MDDLRTLCRLLVDARAPVPDDEGRQVTLWTLAVEQSVQLTLAERITARPREWREAVVAEARRALVDAVAVEAIQREELVRVAGALAAAGIDALLLKGAAWAYTVYPRPEQRMRADTDILIASESRHGAERAFDALGYNPEIEHTMSVASGQSHYRRVDHRGLAHAIDLHWRIVNPLAFAGALPFDRVWRRRVPVAQVGGGWTLCPSDALVAACVHRVAHHGHGSGLFWLLDVHLLASALGAGDWQAFLHETDASGLQAACAHSLALAIDRFGTDVDSGIPRWLERLEGVAPERAFRERGVRPLPVLLSDWRSAGTLSVRLRLVREHLFPPPAYMLARAGTRRSALLPVLYGERAIRGLYRWVTRGR